MIYLVDPQSALKKKCPKLCALLGPCDKYCVGIVYPMYGIDPIEI